MPKVIKVTSSKIDSIGRLNRFDLKLFVGTAGSRRGG